jgi:hypothetical protein
MTQNIWDTRGPLAPEFAEAWYARLARCPHANFSIDLTYLKWEAKHGRRALAILLEEGGRAGALVMREQSGTWTSGWPWRWQAVVEGSDPTDPTGLTADDCAWFYRHASQLAGSRVLRLHMPCPPQSVPGIASGSTLLFAVDRDDQELLASMQANKRRMMRRAQEAGYRVRETTDPCDFRRFAELQREAKLRRGIPAPPVVDAPAPGEDWDEWRLPWMWLLVADRDGIVESGLGDGLHPGGVLEARAGASSPKARQDGVFALLSYNEARLARDRGYRWINLGGDTPFKRELAGRLGSRVSMYCWLGGGGISFWRVRGEALWARMRSRAGRLARDLRVVRTVLMVMVGAVVGANEWAALAGVPWL